MVRERKVVGGIALLGLTSALLASAALPAMADTKVKASYVATLAGFPVGSGTLDFGWTADGAYRADVDAQVRGLATLVANRTATASAVGKASGKEISSQIYNLAIDGGPEPNHVGMAFSGGAVKQIEATELHFPGWDRRVPLLPEHKKGVIDPLAAFVVPLAAGRDPLDGANCEHTAKVFDGRVRYDLRMTYGSKMEVQGKEGSAGPALVCAVAYRPIAGRSRGKVGDVLRVLPAEQRVVVAGVNVIKRHTKPNRTDAGGIVEREAAIHVSNVALLDPKTDKPTKVGFKFLEDGRKVRIARASGETIDR